ncbi:sperm acrosome membrane-associated protein 3 [Dasypus novemcinctus]|uniref:Sperm acrosome membrane-associated protein 3 n=1 Tax=Dasypus novemcinctus TaxID=9361 RepID=A0A077SA20_DASNO|nr:sperm acrosome membrane-associated protein 3 [Dasypus novemcinctus]XP_058139848.1 sperm acrosome membrane-associated protein 3 [Dasypus novemcinctus]XP_058139849.1 sperm acrosome membrane-associated protein 3 [Dasypus novemcinctus]CDM98836.1 TPA: lysozyme C [Dasypus novemcinctus]
MEARSWVSRRRLHPPGTGMLAFVSLLSCLLLPSGAKVFSRCELARELQEFGLEGYRGYSLADWICLAYFTSGFNTAAVDHEADGSTNNGIFQISSRRWCNNRDPEGPNLCRIYCTDLLGPNLKDTVICAMKIAQGPMGLRSWEAWRHHCQGKDLHDWVDGCDF